MDAPAETKKPAASSNKKVIAAAAAVVAVVIVAAIAAVIWFTRDSGDEGRIGYATEATVMLDQDSLQAAMDQAMQNARDGNISLRYKNNAYSEDGVNFSCYIVNSAQNSYDMFITIFADAALEDQLFLSGLLRPGEGFESIELERALDPGDHTVYVALTQVEENEDGEQVIHNQVVHTMDFHVTQ